MKKQLLTMITFLLIGIFASAQSIQTVSFSEIRPIADRNAASLWGDVYPAEPIPYYGLDDEIIAWRLNYSIAEQFPSQEQLLSDRKAFEENGDKKGMWGAGKYGQILISARRNLPVIIETSASLCPEYAEAARLQRLLKKAFKDGIADLERIYYFNHFIALHKVPNAVARHYHELVLALLDLVDLYYWF